MGQMLQNHKKSLGEKVFDLVNTCFMVLLAFLCAYPFYYILIYSLSDPLQASKGVLFWPVMPTVANYETIFRLSGLPMATFISVSITVISTLLSMFVNGLAGYLMSRRTMPCRKLIYRTFILTMYISGGLIPNLLLMMALGIYNTYWIYILPGVTAYYMILTKTYIENIPDSLEESAKLDGANYMVILIKIILPVSMPILATIGLFTAVGKWNDYSTTLIYTTDRNLRTLPYILYQFLKEASAIIEESSGKRITTNRITPASIKMTLVVVTVLPILFAYPYLQRFFVKGIMLGAVKG